MCALTPPLTPHPSDADHGPTLCQESSRRRHAGKHRFAGGHCFAGRHRFAGGHCFAGGSTFAFAENRTFAGRRGSYVVLARTVARGGLGVRDVPDAGEPEGGPGDGKRATSAQASHAACGREGHQGLLRLTAPSWRRVPQLHEEVRDGAGDSCRRMVRRTLVHRARLRGTLR